MEWRVSFYWVAHLISEVSFFSVFRYAFVQFPGLVRHFIKSSSKFSVSGFTLFVLFWILIKMIPLLLMVLPFHFTKNVDEKRDEKPIARRPFRLDLKTKPKKKRFFFRARRLFSAWAGGRMSDVLGTRGFLVGLVCGRLSCSVRGPHWRRFVVWPWAAPPQMLFNPFSPFASM